MTVEIIHGDCRSALRGLQGGRFRCCVTSPPYWRQREYLPPGHPDAPLEIGREPAISDYVQTVVLVCREIRRCLTDDGTLWLNIGDKYSAGGRSGGGSFMEQRADGAWRDKKDKRGWQAVPGMAEKQLLGLPWRVALALQDDGWWLRSEIIWEKPNALPSSVMDRPTPSHEHLFLLAKSELYYFNMDAVREPHTMRPRRRPNGHKRRRPGADMPEHTWSGTARVEPGIDGHPLGRAARTVWSIHTEASGTGHVAPMPRALARRCLLAGSAIGDHVLDPFGGSGTLAVVAEEEGRNATLIDLDERAVAKAWARNAQMGLHSAAGGLR